ncbi:hypothetical protein BJ912DRAFT_971556 [Pholiota molesta]|nr:hypothetical protein BJ912DRAFT_971556 [Pholiota molesta]
MSYTTEDKNPEYVARGLKATLHNERVSQEAKESAARRLQEMGEEVPETRMSMPMSERPSRQSSLKPNQERGYKAALKSKQHAQQMLEESGMTT